MPIYAYRCSACGHAKDVLQKISDPLLTTCPACGAQTFSKQLTAAGFQLKGSGWYVTDFRGGNSGAATASSPSDKPASDTSNTSNTGDKTSANSPAPAASDTSAASGSAI
jgi:putative FmdB family regulatory protein